MIDTSRGFRHKCDLFPSVGTAGRLQIPGEAHSALHPAGNMRVVSWAALQAACNILLGQVDVRRDGDTLTLKMQDKQGSAVYSQIRRSGNQVTWVEPGEVVRPFVLLIAEAMLYGIHPELNARWSHLVETARAAEGTLPLSEVALKRASTDTAVKSAMFAVLDTLYYTAAIHGKSRAEQGDTIPVPGDWPHSPVLLGLPARHGGAVDLTPAGRLTRRALTGVRALLFGPTGSGKTELAKRVALGVNSKLVDIKGRPGLEDRDMIGFIAPTAQGPRWVDGPLARAFRLAQGGERVTLVVDELLRFEPHHRNVFVGMLDEKGEDELLALLGVTVAPGRYYTLDLPGAGEVLFAPVSGLNVLCTTNFGASYVQSGEFDPALKRRFHLMMQVLYPEEAQILPVYERVAGPQAARLAYGLEVATRGMTVSQGQLLAEPMNIGVTLNFLQETQALMAAGLELHGALKEALLVTVAPFCCAFTDEGELDVAALKSLSTTLDKLLR